MGSTFTIQHLTLRRAGLRVVAAVTVSLLLLIMLSAPLFAKHGGEDRDRSDRSERDDRSGSDRERTERDTDRDDDRDRDVADRDKDSSGPGSGETDDSDRSDRDDDSGSGKSGSGKEDSDRDDNSGSGNSGSDKDDDKSGSSKDRDHVLRDGDRAPFAIWRNERGDRVRSGEVIFMSAQRDGASRVRAAGLHVIEEQRLSAIRVRMMRIAVPKGRSEQDVIESLHSIDPKGTATFNHIYEPAGRPALPALLTAAKPSRAKPTKAKIGLVDAGVAASHQMLAQVKVTQRQFGDGSKHDVQHGTAVASRLAAAAPGASIIAANVFTEMLDGQEIASAYAIARALDWLSRQQVAVINLSLAGPANPVLEEITKRMVDKGHVLVAAVGNEGPRGATQYPAAYDQVVGVTAVDTGNRIYIYANQGDSVDFAAMGVDAPAATSAVSTEAVSGTSYAAPIVAAAFARRLARPNPKQAIAAYNALRRQARDLGAPGRDPVYGHGLIDVAR
ncbi:MAG: S8 family serine peptidase [Alphaproteobacteria bacterium]|nr:S8 family serine peptidase [Alphaproteobacteria bacterium]